MDSVLFGTITIYFTHVVYCNIMEMGLKKNYKLEARLDHKICTQFSEIREPFALNLYPLLGNENEIV